MRRWMKVAYRFESVIGSLMRHWYIPSMYAQDRFFNSVVAAEALARIRTGQQSIKLQRELTTLASYAGEVFSSIVDDIDSWSRCVVRIRDNNVAHIGLRANVESSVLYYLSESLYFLVVLCLLRKCEVSSETLARIRDRERARRLGRTHREPRLGFSARCLTSSVVPRTRHRRCWRSWVGPMCPGRCWRRSGMMSGRCC